MLAKSVTGGSSRPAEPRIRIFSFRRRPLGGLSSRSPRQNESARGAQSAPNASRSRCGCVTRTASGAAWAKMKG